jgi:hypothetical protein
MLARGQPSSSKVISPDMQDIEGAGYDIPPDLRLAARVPLRDQGYGIGVAPRCTTLMVPALSGWALPGA